MANKYEIMMVFSVKDGEEPAKALQERFTDLIGQNGTLGEVDEWGKRTLAYPINDEPEGWYVVVNYEAEPTFPAELERRLKITEGVLRFLNIAQ